ncbi:hypothetical protein K8I28_05180 [bacterium]|nr:hypothetical protein [bacterium]
MKPRIFNQILLILAGLFLSSSFAYSQWRTVTAGRKPTQLAVTTDAVWASSEGGLLKFDPVTEKLEFWNIDQGLFSNELSCIAIEPGTEILWIGYENGGLDRFDSRSGHLVQRVMDFYNEPNIFTVNSISFGDGAALVCTDLGVSRMEPVTNDDIWVVEDTYRRFGTWETAAFAAGIGQNAIFVGTNRGLAKASLDSNLAEVSSWELFAFGDTFQDTLQNQENKIQLIKMIDGEVYAAVRNIAMYKYENNDFVRVGNANQPNGISSDDQGNLYLASFLGIFQLDETQNRWVLIDDADPLNQKTWDVIYAFGDIFAAMDTGGDITGGIGRFVDNQWAIYSTNTPGGNVINHIEVSPAGDIWIAAGLNFEGAIRARGVYGLIDGNWLSYSAQTIPQPVFTYAVQGVGFDSKGGVWVGSRGSGMLYIEPSGDYSYFDSMDSTGAHLYPYRSNDNFVLVGDFVEDPQGGMWITNPENYQEKPLAYIPLEWHDDHSVDWIYYGAPQGIDNPFISKMIMDKQNRLWLSPLSAAGSFRPLTLLDPKGTPSDPSDDEVSYFNFPTNNVGFGSVTALEQTADGLLWFGGSDSLYYTNPSDSVHQIQFTAVSLPQGTRVHALEADPLDNLWVGTDFGVYALGADRFGWIHGYTTESGQYPSPLVDDVINALYLEPVSGDLYIGTSKGLSILTTSYRDLRGEYSKLTVKPQPFLVGDGQLHSLQFFGDILQSESGGGRVREIRIFTVSGRLVRTLNRSEASFGWDGRNDDGEFVATGVYMILAIDDSGSTEVGKAAVVRSDR